MGDRQTPRVNLEDMDYLREQSTAQLNRWYIRNKRSLKEIEGYLRCIETVLKERKEADDD